MNVFFFLYLLPICMPRDSETASVLNFTSGFKKKKPQINVLNYNQHQLCVAMELCLVTNSSCVASNPAQVSATPGLLRL